MPCYEYDNTVKYMSRYITAIDSGFACMYSQMGPSSRVRKLKETRGCSSLPKVAEKWQSCGVLPSLPGFHHREHALVTSVARNNTILQ